MITIHHMLTYSISYKEVMSVSSDFKFTVTKQTYLFCWCSMPPHSTADRHPPSAMMDGASIPTTWTKRVGLDHNLTVCFAPDPCVSCFIQKVCGDVTLIFDADWRISGYNMQAKLVA
jgi:hypothetical protein